MTDLNDLRIDEDSQLRSYIYEAFGPPNPNQPSGEEFLTLLMNTPDLPDTNDSMDQIIADMQSGLL